MNQFVETSVSRRIRNIIDLAVEMVENSIILGAPGVGKTVALNAYTSETLRIARVTISKTTARSMRELMRQICEEIEMSTWSTESIYEMDRALRRYHVGDWLIIIDEAQMLPFDHLRQLLSLSTTDEGGQFRFVFCGNEDVLKQVNTDRGALTQIARRIKYREEIKSIDDDDSDLLTNSFGVEGLDAYNIMKLIGRRFHADGVVDILKLATRFSKGTTIKKIHILDALDILSQYKPALEEKANKRKSR